MEIYKSCKCQFSSIIRNQSRIFHRKRSFDREINKLKNQTLCTVIQILTTFLSIWLEFIGIFPHLRSSNRLGCKKHEWTNTIINREPMLWSSILHDSMNFFLNRLKGKKYGGVCHSSTTAFQSLTRCYFRCIGLVFLCMGEKTFISIHSHCLKYLKNLQIHLLGGVNSLIRHISIEQNL